MMAPAQSQKASERMQQDEALSRAVRTLYRAMGGGELEPGVGKAATNMLSSMIGGYNVTPAVGAKALRALAGTAPDAEAFKAAYDRADSASKAGGLDRYLVVLGRIAQDPQLGVEISYRPRRVSRAHSRQHCIDQWSPQPDNPKVEATSLRHAR